MKLLKKSVIAISIVLAISACSEPSVTEKVSTTEDSQGFISSPQEAPKKDEFLELNIDQTSKFAEAQKLINETVEEYTGIVKEVRTAFESNRVELRNQIQENINEIKLAHSEQKSIYDKECSEIIANNESSCNTFGQSVHDLLMKYQELEINLRNKLEELNSEERNELLKYKTKAKNNILGIKAQTGELNESKK
jgi:hypothetical protein